MSIIDINEAANLVRPPIPRPTSSLAGSSPDMDDEVRITVIATGFEKKPFPAAGKGKGRARTRLERAPWLRDGGPSYGAPFGASGITRALLRRHEL
jgi:cell division GTPase FtsZ